MKGKLSSILQEERETPLNHLKLSYPPHHHYINVTPSFLPFFLLRILSFTFMVVLILNLAKGGGAFSSPLGIQCGSIPFWGVTVVNILFLLAVSIKVRLGLGLRDLPLSCSALWIVLGFDEWIWWI